MRGRADRSSTLQFPLPSKFDPEFALPDQLLNPGDVRNGGDAGLQSNDWVSGGTDVEKRA